MKTQRPSRRRRVAAGLSALFTALLLFLAGYYFLYSPAKIDKGIAGLERIFRHHQSDVWAVRFFPDNRTMASCSVDGTLKIFSRQDGRILKVLSHPVGVTNLDISADGSRIATSSYDGNVRIWDARSGQLLRTLKGHAGTSWAVQFSPDARLLISCGEDKTIRIWDAAGGRLLRVLQGHTRNVWDARFSPDGKTIASGGFDGKVRIWDAATGRLLQTISGHTQAVVALAFSHDGRMLATASDDKTIKVWNTAGYLLIRRLEQPEHAQAVAFSPDDRRLLTGGRDKTVLGELLQNIFGETGYNKGVSARLWDLGDGTVLHTFSVHTNDANDAAYSGDGKWIATGSSDKTIALWKVVR